MRFRLRQAWWNDRDASFDRARLSRKTLPLRYCIALTWLLFASPVFAQPQLPPPSWWTRTSMTGGPTPLRIVFYRGYRNPNDIGAGLMGFSGNGLAGWRRLPAPPVFGAGNTYGHLQCTRTEHEYDHVLILNEITLRCY